MAGVIARLALKGREVEVLESKLTAVGYGFLIPFFFVVSGVKFDLAALTDDPIRLLELPLFLALFLIVRGTPALLLYRGVLDLRDRAALAVFSATGLPLIVAITTIAVDEGHMRSIHRRRPRRRRHPLDGDPAHRRPAPASRGPQGRRPPPDAGWDGRCGRRLNAPHGRCPTSSPPPGIKVGTHGVSFIGGTMTERQEEPGLSPEEEADLAALADGRLDPARRAAVEARLAAEPELAAAFERQRVAVAAIGRAVEGTSAPLALRARIERLEAESGRGRRLGRVAASARPAAELADPRRRGHGCGGSVGGAHPAPGRAHRRGHARRRHAAH